MCIHPHLYTLSYTLNVYYTDFRDVGKWKPNGQFPPGSIIGFAHNLYKSPVHFWKVLPFSVALSLEITNREELAMDFYSQSKFYN